MPLKVAHTKSSKNPPNKKSSKKQSSKKSSPSKPAPSSSTPPARVPLRAVNIENAEQYPWGDGCQGWHLVKDEQLSVIEELMPPGTSEKRHHHERAQQFFYILSGELLMEMDGETVLVPTGSGMRMAPGVRHHVRNPSSGPTRFLVISQPPSHGDRVNE